MIAEVEDRRGQARRPSCDRLYDKGHELAVVLCRPTIKSQSGPMTGLELVALGVGSTAGLALGIRSWRSEARERAARGTPVCESPPELIEHGEGALIVEAFERLVREGAVAAATLGRARLLQDVASSADSVSERSAAGRQLVAMFEDLDAPEATADGNVRATSTASEVFADSVMPVAGDPTPRSEQPG